jgi:hypothetical protein
MAKLFNRVVTRLRFMEDHAADGVDLGFGPASNLFGLAQALDIVDGWPSAAARKRYVPRIRKIYGDALERDVARRKPAAN